MNKSICLWSCPRNVSTALMYAFAQREDTKVFDEPLYAHYLKVSGAIHPAREQVLKTLENDGEKVVREVILQKSEKLLFHKLMTHFLIGIDTEFLSEVMNIIGDVDGKTTILFDDMVDTAGTLCNAASALKEQGATKTVAYAAHPVLSGPAIERIAESNLDEIVVTDTIPISKDAKAIGKIRQLSIAELLGETIQRMLDDQSVSSLYAD